MFLLSPILIFLSGVANSLMDISSENYFLDNKFNKSLGNNNNENKWKQPLEDGKREWYYLWLHKPKYKEKFWFSSTALVALTDWWHRFQRFMIIFFCLAIVCYSPVLTPLVLWLECPLWSVYIFDYLLFRSLFSLGFQLFYKNIKNYIDRKREEKRNKKRN